MNRTGTNARRQPCVPFVAILVPILLFFGLREADAEPPGDTIAVVTSIETRSSRLLAERLASAGDQPVTVLRIDELIEILNLVSLAEQESAHVQASGARSFLVPGWGQYVNGERGYALLFFAAETTIQATAFALAYWVLPPSVQWRNLNYLQTPFDEIRDRWLALTASELIPSISVSAAGSILSLALRYFAAEDARSRAIDAIEDGRVVFEPRPIVRTLPW